MPRIPNELLIQTDKISAVTSGTLSSKNGSKKLPPKSSKSDSTGKLPGGRRSKTKRSGKRKMKKSRKQTRKPKRKEKRKRPRKERSPR